MFSKDQMMESLLVTLQEKVKSNPRHYLFKTGAEDPEIVNELNKIKQLHS